MRAPEAPDCEHSFGSDKVLTAAPGQQVEEDDKRHHEKLQRNAEQHHAAWQVACNASTVSTERCSYSALEPQVEEDEKRHHEELQRYAEQHRAAWQVDVEERRRLDKMAEEKAKFAAAITSRRSAEFEALKVRPLGCCFGCWFALKVLVKGDFSSVPSVSRYILAM